jgi:hypothetical protein
MTIMNALNKCIAGLLAFFLMGLYFPEKASCAEPLMLVKADNNSITQHEPKVMAVQEKEIPKVKENKQKGFSKYLWIGLGTVLVGGTIAALASGGSSDGDPDDSGEFRTRW